MTPSFNEPRSLTLRKCTFRNNHLRYYAIVLFNEAMGVKLRVEDSLFKEISSCAPAISSWKSIPQISISQGSLDVAYSELGERLPVETAGFESSSSSIELVSSQFSYFDHSHELTSANNKKLIYED